MGRMGSDMWEKWVECREKTPRLLELPRAREARLPTRARLVEVEEDGREAVLGAVFDGGEHLWVGRVRCRVEEVVVRGVVLPRVVAQHLHLLDMRNRQPRQQLHAPRERLRARLRARQRDEGDATDDGADEQAETLFLAAPHNMDVQAAASAAQVAAFPQLEMLHLQYNRLSALPHRIGTGALQSIDCSHNLLTSGGIGAALSRTHFEVDAQ